MASTYTTNNGVEKPGIGEQAGTWGTTANRDYDLIDQSLDGSATVTLTTAGTSGSPNDLTISDGAVSNGRNRFIRFADSGDLGATAFVRLVPNDAQKIILVRNNLSGSRSINLFQGTYSSSNDYTLMNGEDAILVFNGGGSGAIVFRALQQISLTALHLDDSQIITLGTSDDLSIQHNGNNSIITNATGDLILRTSVGGAFLVQNNNGTENIAVFFEDGGCNLFYNNTNTFGTNANGVNVIVGGLYIGGTLRAASTGSWRFQVATATQIADISNAVNTTNKAQGTTIWDSTNHRLMVSNGSATNSLWYVADGSASVTPA